MKSIVSVTLCMVVAAVAAIALGQSAQDDTFARFFAIRTTFTKVKWVQAIETVTTPTLCANLVDVTGPCRRRRGIAERPQIVSFDGDDWLTSLIQPAPVNKIETTAVPLEGMLRSVDIESSSSDDVDEVVELIGLRRDLIAPRLKLTQYSQSLKDVINSLTVRFIATLYATIRFTTTVTSGTKAFEVNGCTPSPFLYPDCKSLSDIVAVDATQSSVTQSVGVTTATAGASTAIDEVSTTTVGASTAIDEVTTASSGASTVIDEVSTTTVGASAAIDEVTTASSGASTAIAEVTTTTVGVTTAPGGVSTAIDEVTTASSGASQTTAEVSTTTVEVSTAIDEVSKAIDEVTTASFVTSQTTAEVSTTTVEVSTATDEVTAATFEVTTASGQSPGVQAVIAPAQNEELESTTEETVETTTAQDEEPFVASRRPIREQVWPLYSKLSEPEVVANYRNRGPFTI